MQIEWIAFYSCGALTLVIHDYGKNKQSGINEVGK